MVWHVKKALVFLIFLTERQESDGSRVCSAESENSYTLSCGVPVHPGKTPQKRNATTALPTCAGEVAALLGTFFFLQASEGGGGADLSLIRLSRLRPERPVVAAAVHQWKLSTPC